MADHHAPVTASAEDIQRAQETWHNFTILMKITVAGSVVVLGLMALFVA